MGGKFEGIELIPGQMIRISQDGTNTHTIITVLPNGRPFPPENFMLAQDWKKNGLLTQESADLVEKLASRKEAAQ